MMIRRERDFSNSVRYYSVQYCYTIYRTVLYCTVLYCTVLYCTVLYCTVLYCTLQNGTALTFAFSFMAPEWMLKREYYKSSFSVLLKVSIFTICDVKNRPIHFCSIFFFTMCFKLKSTTLRFSILSFYSI
jgi:hypothetical protein